MSVSPSTSDCAVDPILERIEENRRAIYALQKETAVLTGEYVKAQASKKEVITSAIEKIHAYLTKRYSVDPAFIQMLHDNITMAPITRTVFRITKYNTRVTYNTVLYEWQGRRIMYIRADPNHDNYYEGCDYLNGFEMDPTEFEDDTELYHIWWKTMEGASVDTLIEKAIKATRGMGSEKYKNFNDYLVGIPDMHKVIVAVFDLTEGYHYLICDDVLPKDYDFMP